LAKTFQTFLKAGLNQIQVNTENSKLFLLKHLKNIFVFKMHSKVAMLDLT